MLSYLLCIFLGVASIHCNEAGEGRVGWVCDLLIEEFGHWSKERSSSEKKIQCDCEESLSVAKKIVEGTESHLKNCLRRDFDDFIEIEKEIAYAWM